MIAMTRPVHIAKTPIQSRSRGAGGGSLAACEGGAAAGRCGAPTVGAASGNCRRGRRARRNAGISATTRPRSRSPEAPQEINHRRVDVGSPLLLGPVAAMRQDYCSAQLGNKLRHVGNALSHTGKAQDNITLAGDKERRDGNIRTGKRSEKLPVAVDIAVPVETTTKPGARE